jgi:hypothetical protein
MDSRLRQFLLGILAMCTVVTLWLWVSAIEIEEELMEPEWTVPERFLKPEIAGPNSVEDDVDTTKILEPEPQHGWIVPPEPLRKAAGKVKRKIKKTVKKG